MRNLSYENEFCMQFHFHSNLSHFHKKGFALRLALKEAQGNSEMAYSPDYRDVILFKKLRFYGFPSTLKHDAPDSFGLKSVF